MSSIEAISGTLSEVAESFPIPELNGVIDGCVGATIEAVALSAGSEASGLDAFTSSLVRARDHAVAARTALTAARASLFEYMAGIGVDGIAYEAGSERDGIVEAAEARLRSEGVLAGDASIASMTVGQYLEQVDHFAEYVLLSLEPEETGMIAPPSGVSEVLAPLGRNVAPAVDSIIARLGDSPRYQLFTPGVIRLVTDTIRVAPPMQRFELSRMVSDSVHTTSELRAISDTMLPGMLGLAESVLHYQHPANRERAHMSDEQYAQLLATAGSVLDMFARAPYSNQFLRIDKLNMLEEVRQIVRPDAKRI